MATLSLTFDGSGYGPHDGQDIWFTLYDDADTSTPVATRTAMTDGAGVIDETWPMTLIDGHSYTLYWAADLNENGSCDMPDTDHGWSTTFGPVDADVTVTETHNTTFDNTVCDNTVID